jgi:hypothetical protein
MLNKARFKVPMEVLALMLAFSELFAGIASATTVPRMRLQIRGRLLAAIKPVSYEQLCVLSI